MQAKELSDKLITVREVITVMRDTGMDDAQIIKQFGLNPVQLGATTMKIYKAIKAGKIKPDDTLQDIAKLMGFKSHNAVLYHLNKLKKHGYIQ